MKISDILSQKSHTISFEFFPPKTPEGVSALLERAAKLSKFRPAWVDVTCGAGGSTAANTFDLCVKLQRDLGLTVMMHLTCVNISEAEILDLLNKCKEAGIKNILALRGDPPKTADEAASAPGAATSGIDPRLKHAIDLVTLIRQNFGDFFSIGVAGYPEGHPDASSFAEDLWFLKEKIQAGADFVLTQLFYDVYYFLDFVKQARDIGITVPIIPGIMPIVSYGGLLKMTGLCKARVSDDILRKLETMTDVEVRAFGIQLGIRMCTDLLNEGVRGLHFYTLNLDFSCIEILEKLHI